MREGDYEIGATPGEASAITLKPVKGAEFNLRLAPLMGVFIKTFFSLGDVGNFRGFIFKWSRVNFS